MINEIEITELDETLKGDCALIDCREDEEVALGMIPNAVHMALSEFDKFADSFPKNETVLIYCRSGKRSLKACELASAWTDKKLISLAGGYLAYQEREKGE